MKGKPPMLALPVIQTERMHIRPLTPDDLDDVHRTYVDAGWADDTPEVYAEHREYVTWSSMNHLALARLYQPPYGERAIVLQASGAFVGLVGLVPAMAPFGLLPYYANRVAPETAHQQFPEFGLFWALRAAHRGQGYATEAARGLIDQVFAQLNLMRIIATTEYDNAASMAVMRRLGMTIERNPHPDPAYLQVVGILENINGRPVEAARSGNGETNSQ
jgi:RimJ/RimL family protein N-acetyltransferase